MNPFTSRQDSSYPASQFFGAQRASASTGTAPSSSGLDFTKQHVVITGIVLIALAYWAWHYTMTH